MMRQLTPAQRHQARVLAKLSSGQTEQGATTTGSQYELMLYQLAEDRRRLKQLQSIKSKIELKKQLLPAYQAWIDGVLAGGKGGQDDVLTTVLVWQIDVGEYEQALRIAQYVVQFNLTLPDQYQRDIPTMLLDEFAGAYLHGKLAEVPELAVTVLEQVNELTLNKDAPDQARAKLYKALAYAQIAAIDLSNDHDADKSKEVLAGAALTMAKAANDNLHKALALFAGVGVKKDIERLERRLKKSESL
jgi:hypothetical protein